MLTVKQVEEALFRAFPREQAMPGDRIGLLVGDPAAPVRRAAVALDQAVASVETAAARGCNVLVTHHPVLYMPVTRMLRVGSELFNGGDAAFAAAAGGVALIAMHTNLDCAPETHDMLLAPVGFAYAGPLTEPESEAAGLGQVGIAAAGPVPLGELARRYAASERFGRPARTWGNLEQPVARLAACSGDGGEVVGDVLRLGCDCLVCGELRYHEAMELARAGVGLIELGHDVSELPYRYYLRDALIAAGLDPQSIEVLEPAAMWHEIGASDERSS
jgi:putative NIF3 family GTP cyclohydrolase 1 type 2